MFEQPPPWTDDELGAVSQTSRLSQMSHMLEPVTPCHAESQPCHTLSHAQNFISLEEVGNYLDIGGAPRELRHEIIKLLAGALVKSDAEESEKRNLKQEVLDLISVTSGDISVTFCDKALQLVTKRDKANLRQIMHRLCIQNILKKQGKQAGVYHIVDSELEEIDWMNAETEEFPITLPLDLDDFVKIMPKNLIVVAGAPNSGKTAFLMNIVRNNMFNNNINYYSSEMSEGEFRDRILKFGDPPPEKWKFKAYNRCSDFADVIQPNDVNIIDFLEIHDEFWKVGGMMRDIYEKLDKGIAIIALQKQAGAKMGRGGVATLEKPRLYLSMDAGKITIEKGKNWRYQTINPNGMNCLFKLVQGCKFIKQGDWTPDSGKL